MIAPENLRVLIMSEHASMKIGGEAALPLYYFKRLRERNIESWLIVHGRFAPELRDLFPNDVDRMHFVDDTLYHKTLWLLGHHCLPTQVDEQTLETFRHIRTQMLQRKIARRLIRQHDIQIVHEVEPISPKQVSALTNLGAPLVIGPMCGGMDYPPAFQHMQSRLTRAVQRGGRIFSQFLNRLVPGKLRADALVVANEQTRRALPKGTTGMIYEMPESGVDLSLWQPPAPEDRPNDGKVRFVFLGRLVGWKAPDLLLEAFKSVADRCPDALLEILGDGELRPQLETRTRELQLTDRVTFAGWLSRPDAAARMRAADVMVLPSLRECGGAVILEAMAMGIPSVVTHWGGPGLYVDDATGIRVPPTSRDDLIRGLAGAMIKLAESPALRQQMSEACKRRVHTNYFDWDSKFEHMLDIYRKTIARTRTLAEMESAEPCGCC